MATTQPTSSHDHHKTTEDERPGSHQPPRRSRPRSSLVSFPGVPSSNRVQSVHISGDEYKAIKDLVDLAKQFLEQQEDGDVSARRGSGSGPGSQQAPSEKTLDPYDDNFDAREWAKSFYRRRSESCGVRKAGVAFRKLSVSGYGADTAYQQTVANAWWLTAAAAVRGLLRVKRQQVRILHDLEGVVRDGEMLCVLGPPGSGCSTFLRTMAGDTQGTRLSDDAHVNYRGVRADEMSRYFRGDAIYTAEEDIHFPALPVADTLFFAARARAPKTLPEGLTTDEYAAQVRDVTMAMLGILHTMETPVGGTNGDTVRGVSGGERKRVSIAEAALSFAPIQCWDNSTRGLDSAATVDLCRALRVQSDVMGMTSLVAIYQAPQAAYELFDKVLVLYEGRQIYLGKTTEAKAYFRRLGFECPHNQTTPDFLTSMTSPAEREGIVRPGYEARVPHTPDDFAEAWRASRHRRQASDEVDAYDAAFPVGGRRTHYEEYLASKKSDQSRWQRWKSPYTVSYPRQVALCLSRGFKLLRLAPQMTLTMVVISTVQALIVSSVFFRMGTTAESIKGRSTLVFTATLVNAFGCVLEVGALYAKRDIVEKHVRYALYHSSAEAIADLVVSLPYKLVNALVVNSIFYWMCNLRPEAGAFFFSLLVQFAMTLAVSLLFRFVASVTKSQSAAMAPSTILLLALGLYTGFAIPPKYYKSYAGWIAKLSPVAYGFEALMINEFGGGRQFPCETFVPSGPTYDPLAGMMELTRICAVPGGVPGATSIDGAMYINGAYGYQESRKWRNAGLIFVFAAAYFMLHLLATELVTSKKSNQEMLVFPQGKVPAKLPTDVESRLPKGVTEAPSRAAASPTSTITPLKSWSLQTPSPTHDRFMDHDDNHNNSNNNHNNGSSSGSNDDNGELGIDRQTAIFHWSNVCYDVKTSKKETKRILDNVDGWCEPGTLTALMGVSGAGKTTLLDALASRLSIGVVTGEMLVDGAPRDASFQQKTGYVKQQDQHLLTSTVREALTFSAVLRQPPRFSREEKVAYVDKVISILGMEEYADAVVGVPGEGLNVEQRKKLTIGVELAARPALLLFLDEPTSGLDSQTSLSICNLLETLRDSGQAILCTIHQPSAVLFERFDRLLLLARGGRTVYFGQIGPNANVLTDYFIRNGGPKLLEGQNPAEYILDQVRGGGSGDGEKAVDWPEAWQRSIECEEVKAHLARLKDKHQYPTRQHQEQDDPPFAAPLPVQLSEVSRRLAQHYWRSPEYVYSKVLLTFGAALFIGLSMLGIPNTQVGVNAQGIAIFMFLATHLNLLLQIIPVFAAQRTLYESREQPSRTYSWAAFMGAQVVVELLYNGLMAGPAFVAWYYLVGLNRNAAETGDTAARGGLAFLFMLAFFLQASTFAHMMGAKIDLPDQAAGLSQLVFLMMFIFNGLIAAPPSFWTWVYRVNPFTYVVEGLLGTGLANARIRCAQDELLRLDPPPGQTCGQYLGPFVAQAGGYLTDAAATQNCSYCSTSSTNEVLASLKVDFSHRWRDLGFLVAYIFFNAAVAFALYWTRVPKPKKEKGEQLSASSTSGPGQDDRAKSFEEATMVRASTQSGSSRNPRDGRWDDGAVRQGGPSQARRALGTIRSSVHGGIQGLRDSQVLRGSGKRYWDDEDAVALESGTKADEWDEGSPGSTLGAVSEGEEGDQDVPIGYFSMQKPKASPQFWL
ncbi:ZEB2-regulated ABC transporter 1 [Colletotrichum orbiculare MAFF 240422]|uniref:ZEB2-regulated ABC transporter 1 n=1 Tax=Colletotrichum orbiculare (strain 104-T / ATCC 96160 / CBS 514.97 / LARS 414 / MAFF 240422) TaxID=1213857 RepID=N4VWG7_COLOR|nr:ZEB2-regulated ABC transporter 1 [Colletotrichum orbiculare MAFF 240422]